MTQHEQIIYLLGYVKATIEWLCDVAARDKSWRMFNLLAEFEQHFNREMSSVLRG